jgi:OOP family OmpA-OmpF porin
MKKLLFIIGLIAAIILAYYCLSSHSAKIQSDIKARLTQSLSDQGISNNISMSVSGRDVTLTGIVPEGVLKESAGKVANALYGVRVVNNKIKVVEPPPVVFTPIVEEEPIFDLDVQPSVEDSIAMVVPEFDLEVDLEVEPAPALEPVVDVCQEKLAAMLVDEKIHFASGGAHIQSSSYGLLNRIASVAKDCKKSIVHVHGYTDSSGDMKANVRVSLNRARAVGKYLMSKGVHQEIRVVGNGPNDPVADNSTSEGRAENRRIEFKVFKIENE